MEFSLMTLNLFFIIFYKYMLLHDKEELEENYEEMLDVISGAGFKYVDILGMEVDCLGIDFVKEQLDKHNLKVNSYMFSQQFAKTAADDSNRALDTEIINAGKQAVKNAQKLETKTLMLIPQVREDMSGISKDEIHANMIRRMTPIVSYAKEVGITTVIEDTPNLQLHLCSTEDLKNVSAKIPEVRIVYDSGNMVLVDEDPVKYFHNFENEIAHVHLKDMQTTTNMQRRPDRGLDGRFWETAPSGAGVIDFKSVCTAVKNSNFKGHPTIEFTTSPEMSIPDALVASREYFEKLWSEI